MGISVGFQSDFRLIFQQPKKNMEKAESTNKKSMEHGKK